MITDEQIVLRPIVTEKSTLSSTDSKYVFAVLKSATKVDVKKAVERLFKVSVIDVNTVNVRGKTRRAGKSIGVTSSWKKAYVKLKAGQKIELLEGMKQ